MTVQPGPTLLLLHGFTGAGASWSGHLDAFAGHARVLAPDLPGHGRNPATATIAAMTVEATADALASYLAAEGALPAVVLGYSMGARIALRLAVAHPAVVVGLILESPSAGIADPIERSRRREADEALADRIERDGIEDFVTTWEQSAVFAAHASLEPDLLARQRAIRLASDPAGLAASLRAAGQGAMEPLHDLLDAVTAPTLVIGGTIDTVGRPRAEQVAAGIAGARLELLEGVGHTPHLEAPAVFRRLVLDFLSEVPAA
ncbi:MAG TPA: alpha/beta fold hydrolase [Candidatus Limnocylindrales bacterium]|nr:alpha/beta fold hydrolase [Candidatus Limnocylindrales bacterium]